MDGSIQKKISKYLVEIKKVKGKFSFFPDLFAKIQKKDKKNLSEKLIELQNAISDISKDEEDYKKSIRRKLNAFDEKTPKKILEVINKIENELDSKTDNDKSNDYISNSKIRTEDLAEILRNTSAKEIDLKNIFEKIPKIKADNGADLSKAHDIIKSLKNISKNVKLLKRHTSWFFQKDNSAKIIYNLSLEIIKSIKNNLNYKNYQNNEQNTENEKDKKMKSINIHSDLLAMKDYIAEALKLRMIEKNLHENDRDDLKLLLMSLYEDFSFFNNLLFKEEFEELPQSFNELAGSDTEIAKKYYIKLITNDLNKFYKTPSSYLKKLFNSNAPKAYKEFYKSISDSYKNTEFYKKMYRSFKELKEYIKNNDDNILKKNLQSGGELICEYANKQKKLLEDANISISKDDTLKIMYNLYNDYNDFIQILGGKLTSELDMDEYFEVDEKTQTQYYLHHFFTKMSSLLQLNGIKWFNFCETINSDLIEGIYTGDNNKYREHSKEIKEKLTEGFDKVVKQFNALADVNFFDSSQNISDKAFDDWYSQFKETIKSYISITEGLNNDDFKPSLNDTKLTWLKNDLTNNQRELYEILDKFKDNITVPANKEKFVKYREEKEKVLKKDKNGKYFAKLTANVNKILGKIVTVLSLSGVGKVIITTEGSSIAETWGHKTADIDNNYSVFLAAEVSADCALFKAFDSSAIKIRVYFALGYPGLINSIQENFGSKMINAINFNKMKEIEGILNVNNNLSAGSVYFSPYSSNIVEKKDDITQNTKTDAGKSHTILKEIKNRIKYFKPSALGKIFKSSLTKLIYNPLNKIYESLKTKIKNVSSSEQEIEEIIIGGKNFINNMIEKINKKDNKYKDINSRSDSNEIITKLKDLSENFKDLGESLLSATNSSKKSENSGENPEDFIKSVGSAHIYGDVLASIPIAEKRMHMMVSVENADTKGIIPDHEYKFNSDDIKGSLIACVADLTVKINLEDLTATVHNDTKISVSVKFEKAKKDEEGILNYTSLMKFIKENMPGQYVKFVKNFDSYPKTLKDGIRIRAYLYLKGITKAIPQLIDINQSMQKGKIKFFR